MKTTIIPKSGFSLFWEKHIKPLFRARKGWVIHQTWHPKAFREGISE